tara:strand:+ start:1094 stop:1444 length:351 start_codon:yes stop_codon:yes gene_type:complete
MYAFIGEVLKFFKRQFLFCSLFIILICLLAVTQYQYWLGDYNREGLINLKEEIALVELERQIIENDNQGLIEEKEKLNSGKEALEGVARTELGMIKPGETFYVFKDVMPQKTKENK